MPAIVDYEVIKAGVVQWVRDTAGEFLYAGQDGLGAVWWVEDAHDYQVSPYVELTWNDGGNQGQDAVVWESIDGDEDTLTPKMLGLRQVVVTVEIRSRGSVNVPRQVVEALRASFDNELTAVTLREDYGLSPVRVEAATVGGFTWEGRLAAVGSLELRFSYRTIAENTALTVERIRNVGIRNQMRDCAGNLIGSNIQELVGLDYPPVGGTPVGDNPFTRGFDWGAFGSGVPDGDESPFSSGFEEAAFGG